MKKLQILLPMLLMTIFAIGQKKTVTGTVINKADNSPIAEATITIKGSSTGTQTDKKGNYTIVVPSDTSTLMVSHVGYESASISTVGSTGINFSLNQSPLSLNEVVVTGYQSQRKADLTGAVSVVKMADIKDVPSGNPMQALQGRVPGLIIANNGNLDGNVGVTLRGITTLNSNNPLYIIDGVPTERGLQEINPNDIASIQILKDASSASIYGSRAAAGVIIVTTKRGSEGKTTIDFDAYTSIQSFNSKLKPLNTIQHGQAYWQAAVNDNQDPDNNGVYTYDWNKNFVNPVLNKVIVPQYIDAAHTMMSANTNWFNEISQQSLLQSYNVSMSRGTKFGHTFFSMGLFDNNGVIKSSNDKKVNIRLNTDFDFFNGRLKVGENLSGTYGNEVILPISDIFLLSQIENPIIPVHTVDGGWGGPVAGMDDRQNPARLINDNKQNRNNFGRIFGNVYIDLAILRNLHFKSSASADIAGNYFRSIQLPYVSGFLSSNITQVATSYDNEATVSWNNTLNYDLNINKNRFTFLLGEEQVKDKNQNFGGSGQGVVLQNINYAYLSSATNTILVNGAGSANSLLSYFGKVNYIFDNKYLLSATLRNDGSSKFGINNRYGLFPAFSAGWRISEEKFIQQKLPQITELKLRYGWGQTGNQNIANNATQTLYQSIYGTDITWNFNQGTAYNIMGTGTGQMPSGFTPIQTGNPNLKWETTTQSNFGLDFGLFDNRLSGSIDYFIKTTTDILITPPYLAVLGQGGSTTYNGASLQNKGLEAIATYSAKLGHDLSISVTGNVATYRNKVLKLPADVLTGYPGNGTTETVLNRSINSLYGYKVQDIFSSEQELASSPIQPGKGLGRIRYANLNGDSIIDNNDQEFLGTTDPKFSYGLNVSVSYKNFDLSFFLQGVQGGLEYNGYKYLTDFTSLAPGSNWGQRTLDAWTPQNPKSTIPALTLINANNEGRYSSYFLENASYLKLRNIQLAYNLKGIPGFRKIQRAKIYIQASNLLRFKSKSNTMPDPENPNSAYPIPLIGTVGVNFSF